ncbi:hypothetical protein HY628_00215 [Candidatus Uhrbacteria bacterium]|nr:hypothetical protein [Candidatus Uhrbacteria bacterium]
MEARGHKDGKPVDGGISPLVWASEPLIIEALTVAGRKGMPLVFLTNKGKLRLSETGHLQIQRGQNWLIAREDPGWRELALLEESFKLLCAYADERVKAASYQPPSPFPKKKDKAVEKGESDIAVVNDLAGSRLSVYKNKCLIGQLKFLPDEKEWRTSVVHQSRLRSLGAPQAEVFGEAIRLANELYPDGLL